VSTRDRLEVAAIVLASIARRDDDVGNALALVPASLAIDLPEGILARGDRVQRSPVVEPTYLLPLNDLARFALGEEEE
jgi:hypothetical protein